MRNSMQALLCFIDMAPAKLREELPDSALRNPEFWRDLWSLARKDAGRILQMLEQVALTVAEPDCRSVEEAELTDVLAGAAIAASDTIGAGRVVLDVAPGLPRITADLAMLRRLFITLIGRVAKMSAVDGKINVSAHNVITVWGTPGVRIFVAGQGRAWTDAETGSVFAAFGAACEIRELGLDMLGAFSIVFHHGGDIAVHKSAPAGPGFEVRLPLGLARAEGPGFGDKLLERLFTHFDAAGDAPRA
jgi:K+-sensing histidine kinase KdpD